MKYSSGDWLISLSGKSGAFYIDDDAEKILKCGNSIGGFNAYNTRLATESEIRRAQNKFLSKDKQIKQKTVYDIF